MSFSDEVGKFTIESLAQCEKIHRTASITVYGYVINASPVGDPSHWKNPPPKGYVGGTFRNSWFTTVSAPSTELKRAPNANGADAISEMVQTVESKKGAQSYFMTNNLPYAQRLSEGWSTQAPQGWIRAITASFPRYVDELAKRNGFK